jgi:hypothetical protein
MLCAARVIAHRRGPAIRRQLEHSLLRISSYTTISSRDWEDVDVAIVGGGPVGLALACALCQSPPWWLASLACSFLIYSIISCRVSFDPHCTCRRRGPLEN